MLSDSIHESSKSYLGNRRELVNFLSSQGYKSPHYIANDIEDNKISSYYLVNIAVMLTNRASRSYDEKINNWAGLFWWTYTQIRLHTLFCNYPGPNFENGFFKTLHNENCGFLGPQEYANITGQGVYDIYNYLTENPSGLDHINKNLKFIQSSNASLINIVNLINMLNIKLINNINLSNVLTCLTCRAHACTREDHKEIIDLINKCKINKNNSINDISKNNLGYVLCYPYKLHETLEKKKKNSAQKEKITASKDIEDQHY